ncbi:MAG: 3-hydroxybutyrate dehydrogenase [Bryobacterales bacterium]|nr:3-hydroxybutyrate dehydrogenase [Bryobacterales bacterium]
MVDLTGKTALVTGSTSGIGAGIAGALAGAGARVILNGFGDPEAIETLCARLGGRYLAADLAIPGQIRDLMAAAGPVDILVNNAGVQHVAPVEEFPEDRWDALLAINLTAAFHTIRHAVAGMKQRGWGRIINIASTHGLSASRNKSAYVASKHGLVGLTRAVALETAGTGVTCNAICPGWVLTPLVEKQVAARAAETGLSLAEAQVSLVAEKTPSGQFVTPEQVGAFAVFLCSPAADQITGAPLSIDGGWMAQ